MKIDLKNKFHILIILIVGVVGLMTAMIIINLYTQQVSIGEDADKDGVSDELDNCPLVSNPNQSDIDHDSIGDVCDTCTDTDGDGYGNPGFPANTCLDDNCPAIPNANQTDSDQDTIGDACDVCPNDPLNDADTDGICGSVDNCPSMYNPEQQDTDTDGIGDICETPPIAMFTFYPLDPIHDEAIQFWDNTSLGGGILQTWNWTFGDNSSSREQHPTHSYTNIGSYTITLNVTDINGKTSIISKNITVYPNDPPEVPTILGQSIVIGGLKYRYSFKTIDPDGNKVYYTIDWGDNTNTEDLGPYLSGFEINATHQWITTGNYTIMVKSRDTHNTESNSTLLTVRVHFNVYISILLSLNLIEEDHQILFFEIPYW